MKMSLRWRYVICLGLALVGSVAVARSQWISSMGLDFWQLPTIKARMEEMKGEAQRLDEVCERAKHRLQMKDELILDLINGRISFAQTVEAFRLINDPDSGLMIKMRKMYGSSDEHEMIVQNVMIFVKNRVNTVPEVQSSDVMHRIESEMREYLGQGNKT